MQVKTFSYAIGLGLVMLAYPLSAQASNLQTAPKGYLTSEQSTQVVKNNFNECVLTSSDQKMMKKECGDFVQVEPEYKTVIKKVSETFSQEVLFGFDSSKLTETGKQAISNFLGDLDYGKDPNVQVREVAITGYTDIMGSESYNQALSESRAKAVSEVLVSKGYPAQKINVVGLGKSMAVTGEKCKELVSSIKNKQKQRDNLISCMSPDRKVDVFIDFEVKVKQNIKK